MTGCGAVSHIKRDKMRIDNDMRRALQPVQRRQHIIIPLAITRQCCRVGNSVAQLPAITRRKLIRARGQSLTGAIISATRGSICACIFHLASKEPPFPDNAATGWTALARAHQTGSTAFPSPPQPARGPAASRPGSACRPTSCRLAVAYHINACVTHRVNPLAPLNLPLNLNEA